MGNIHVTFFSNLDQWFRTTCSLMKKLTADGQRPITIAQVSLKMRYIWSELTRGVKFLILHFEHFTKLLLPGVSNEMTETIYLHQSAL